MLNRSRTILRVTALAGCVFAGATLYGCSGGDSGGTDVKKPNTGDVGGSGSMQGAGAPTMGGGQMGQMMGGMGGGGSQGSAGAAIAANANTSMPAHRADPFKPTWPPPPQPNVLSFMAPVRIADTGTANPIEQPNIEIHEVPQMRVAGILSGSGIYALLEGGPGDGSVVKPGDAVGDYKVASINQDSLILKKTVKVATGTQTYTQVVPLTDSGQAGASVISSPAAGRAPVGRPQGRPGTGGLGAGKFGGGASE